MVVLRRRWPCWLERDGEEAGGEEVKKARTWRGWTQGTFTYDGYTQTDTLTNLLSFLWS